MPSTTPYRRRDIVLVPFPFTDLTSSKRRPALVISPDSFNAQQQDLVVAAITSQIVSTLSRQLALDFGRGFGEKSLRRMVQSAETFPDREIVAALLR